VKAKRGRKPLMTPQTIEKLEQAFAMGCTDIEACLYADIGKDTLYNYQANHPEFIERKEALKNRPFLLARNTIVKSLSNDPEMALKYMERKKKDEFSLRVEQTGKDGEAIKVIIEDYGTTNQTPTKTTPRPSDD